MAEVLTEGWRRLEFGGIQVKRTVKSICASGGLTGVYLGCRDDSNDSFCRVRPSVTTRIMVNEWCCMCHEDTLHFCAGCSAVLH